MTTQAVRTHSAIQIARYADRPVVRRAVLIAALGNYTHPDTRHSIAQYLLPGLEARATAHDQALRAEVERRVRRVVAAARRTQDNAASAQQNDTAVISSESGITSATAPHLFDLPSPLGSTPSEYVRDAHGWITKTSFLVDTLPPKGHAVWRQSTASPNMYPYVLVDATFYHPKLLMNVSGPGVHAAAVLSGVDIPNDILVIHDELSRAFGKVSTKDGGSAAGHNGVRSVLDALRFGNDEADFTRVRIGIDRPPPGIDVSRWVLGRMPRDQLAECEWPAAPPATGRIAELTWAQVSAWCGHFNLQHG